MDRQIGCFVPGDTPTAGIEITFRTGAAHGIEQAIRDRQLLVTDYGRTAMAQPDNLRASIKICMFDQYGTVVDMQTGLTEAAAPFLAVKGWQGDPDSFVTWWRRTHFENSMIDALLHREHTSYREVGHRSVAFVLERAGIAYTLDEVHDLVAHIERLDRFRRCPKRSLDYRRVIRW
jgi:hypothetical protein